ncbi:Alpha-galactosidase Mel36A [Lactobacillus helveticus]|nr:Alpha-galactosidase Mel36A [Lactobacillus helveticus]NRO20657.1 Alpha-galactosidase Mel36A [Lactobacillus helveticus]NRO32870.1 Alpha-galactosidase Mel36A [Lactobacillus helveticus]NRO40985.1 Alpha-galactosidase Mel36A [Lactobacillus helveticus]NRO46436.1 Alpha-galactosidase Mel36A [Lactobacillus helveticus]
MGLMLVNPILPNAYDVAQHKATALVFFNFLKVTGYQGSVLPADQQGEVYHRYVLGLYDLMEKLVSDYPDILFEDCSLVVADVLTLEWLITCLRFGRAMILCC